MSERHLLDFDDARTRLLGYAAPVCATETRPLSHCLGRVLAQDQIAPFDVPSFNNSQMDGYALRADDLQDCDTLPVSQRIAAGDHPAPLQPGTAARIFTGAPLPAGADAVVMQEQCSVSDAGVRFAVKPAAGAFVRTAGSDIGRGDTVLSAGTRLLPQHLGLAASMGLTELPLFKRLRVAIFFTGNEIVRPGAQLKAGQIYNSNAYILRGMLEIAGCEVLDLGIVPDDLDATIARLSDASEQADLICTTGGVSVGEGDFVKPALEALGKLEMWKLSIKPGKPLAFGYARSTPFIGMPGNPVSAFATFALLARPFIGRLQGAAPIEAPRFKAIADFDWDVAGDRREFVRVKRVDDTPGAPVRVALFRSQNSALLSSVAWADGLVDIREGQTIARGDSVDYLPFTGLLC